MTQPFDCMKELMSVRATLNAAREELRNGNMPSLFGLDQRVGDICVRLQGADRPTQEECLPELSKLLSDLEVCERDMRAWNDNPVKMGKGQ